MSRGGPRPHAGRKSNAELAECHKQMDRAIKPADWKAIYARLAEIVKTGDPNVAIKAARLLIHQRWGDGAIPTPAPDPEEDEICQIKIVEVNRAAADYRPNPDPDGEGDKPDDDNEPDHDDNPAVPGAAGAADDEPALPESVIEAVATPLPPEIQAEIDNRIRARRAEQRRQRCLRNLAQL